MFISVTFRILSFHTLPFIPQKKSASNFPQRSDYSSGYRNNIDSVNCPVTGRIACPLFSWSNENEAVTQQQQHGVWRCVGHKENFWTLWCKGRLTEADTASIWFGATPSGLTSAHLHHPPIFSTTTTTTFGFLANVNWRSRSLYAIARPSVCLSVVCLSVTFVRPTQAVQIFGNISTALGTLAIHWHPLKILWRSS